MAEKLDFKKEYKNLYLPGRKPGTIDVPAIRFIAVDGTGDPNGESYQQAVSLLYALTFTIKMSKMGGKQPAGYVEYTVPPLEGFWSDHPENTSREQWHWTSVIRQPDFVNEEVLAWAKKEAARKKPQLDYSRAKLWDFCEGLCVQMMHTGPFAEEPASIALLHGFITQEGLVPDYSDVRRHHEIYLSNPRRTAPEKLKTVLRLPVRRTP